MAYAVRSDIPNYGISEDVLSGITTTKQDAALASASSFMDGYLRAVFALPLVSWGPDLRECCCVLAVENMLFARGLAPGAGGDDEKLIARADAKRSWLKQISAGTVLPEVSEAASGPAYAPLAESDCSRGY